MTSPATLPYVVVLAGGEGTRLAPLTRALYGTDLPKQFAVLQGERSLLQQTVERARLVTSWDQILVVVTEQREAIARAQLAAYPGVELVVEPKRLDTGPGLLLPLTRLVARTANARVIFLPADHFVADARPLVEALRATERPVLRDRLTLLGITPTSPEVEYGWIARGQRIRGTGAFAVDHFLEKPPAAVANELWRTGALWNTFISAGPLHVFWDLARQHLPRHTAALERYAAAIGTSDEGPALRDAYRIMPPASFSHDLLAHARSLLVLPVSGTGWSDWGTPQRVFASLRGTPGHDRLVERIRGDHALAS